MRDDLAGRAGAIERIGAALAVLGFALLGLFWLGDAGAWIGGGIGAIAAIGAISEPDRGAPSRRSERSIERS